MEPCPYCGSRVDATSRTCAGCGAAAPTAPAPVAEPEPAPGELLEELRHLKEKRLAEEAERDEESQAEAEAEELNLSDHVRSLIWSFLPAALAVALGWAIAGALTPGVALLCALVGYLAGYALLRILFQTFRS